MRFARTDGSAPSANALRWRRWLVVGVLSLLLHALALNWMGGFIGLPEQDIDSAPPEILRTVLIQAPPAKAPAPSRQVAPRPKPKAPHPPAASTAAAPPPPTIAPAPDMSTAAQVATPAPAGPADIGLGDPSMALMAEEAATQSLPATDNQHPIVDPPPSATLQYDVEARREGQMVYGHGTIAWKFNGSHYTINGTAGILFLTLLDFSSHGQTDAFGIAPEQYTEKRFRRPPTDTIFNRESKLINFPASGKTIALQGGEQDRASIVWQLAGIGRADAGRFVPDAQIALFIAGVRDGSTWNIKVLGEEEIKVGLGKLRAWHVRRTPRPGDKDQTIDIWLAPSRDWYPVKLRYTDSTGEYLDLSLADIAAATPR